METSSTPSQADTDKALKALEARCKIEDMQDGGPPQPHIKVREGRGQTSSPLTTVGQMRMLRDVHLSKEFSMLAGTIHDFHGYNEGPSGYPGRCRMVRKGFTYSFREGTEVEVVGKDHCAADAAKVREMGFDRVGPTIPRADPAFSSGESQANVGAFKEGYRQGGNAVLEHLIRIAGGTHGSALWLELFRSMRESESHARTE